MNKMCKAILNNDLKQVKRYIRQNINVNTNFGDGITPLLLAVSKGNLRIVSTLLKNGADIYKKDKFGNDVFDIVIPRYKDKIEFILYRHKRFKDYMYGGCMYEKDKL